MKQLEKICREIGYENVKGLFEGVSRFVDISNEELAGAEQLKRWYDIELPGVRKLLRLYFDEYVSLLANDSRFRVYASVPCPTVIATAFNLDRHVRISTAELCAMVVLHGILGVPVVSADYGVGGRCAMMKNRRAYIASGLLPKPDVLWSFGLLCDECCKTDELISEERAIPQMNSFCAKSFSDMRFARYEESLRDNIRALCTMANIIVPDVHEAKEKANLVAMLCAAICCTNAAADSPPLKAATISLIQTSLLMAFDDVDALIDALKEVKSDMRRIRRTEGFVKLYSYYIPPCVPEFGAVFEDCGMRLVGGAAFITRPLQHSHSADLAGAAAAAWDSSILSRSSAEYAAETAKAIRKYNCAAYLNGMFEFDRWLGAGHILTNGMVERLSDKPVFHLDIDFWGRNMNINKLRDWAETIGCIL